MMRKYLVLLVAAFVLMAVPVYAVNTEMHNTNYVITNNAATRASTCISTSIIPGGGKSGILAMRVTPLTQASSSENVVAIYDSATLEWTVAGYLEGEIESPSNPTVSAQSIERVWVRPLRIANGVTIVQGAYTVVELEWIQLTP